MFFRKHCNTAFLQHIATSLNKPLPMCLVEGDKGLYWPRGKLLILEIQKMLSAIGPFLLILCFTPIK